MMSSVTINSSARSSGHHQCLTNVAITVKVVIECVDEYIVIEEIISLLSRFLKND